MTQAGFHIRTEGEPLAPLEGGISGCHEESGREPQGVSQIVGTWLLLTSWEDVPFTVGRLSSQSCDYYRSKAKLGSITGTRILPVPPSPSLEHVSPPCLSHCEFLKGLYLIHHHSLTLLARSPVPSRIAHRGLVTWFNFQAASPPYSHSFVLPHLQPPSPWPH